MWEPSCCPAILNTFAEVDIVSCLKQASRTQQDSRLTNEVNIEGGKGKGRNPHNSLSPLATDEAPGTTCAQGNTQLSTRHGDHGKLH